MEAGLTGFASDMPAAPCHIGACETFVVVRSELWEVVRSGADSFTGVRVWGFLLWSHNGERRDAHLLR